MKNPGVKWGVILGIAVAIWTLALHVMGWYTTRIGAGLIADNVAIILPLTTVTLAVLEHRRRIGSLTLWQAAKTGFAVGAVSAPISVGFLWIYHHYINPGWMDYLVEHAQVQGAAAGLGAADIAMTVDRMRRSSTDAAQITAGFIGSMVICTLIGVIAGAILRRRPAG